MSQYSYKARRSDGQIFSGVVEAGNESEASDILRDKGLEVIFLEFTSTVALVRKSYNPLAFFKQAIKKKEVVIFTRQLAVMISANVSVVESLRIINQQAENVSLKEIVTNIADEVESGVKLSDALSRYPKIFSMFFTSMVKSGETSGKLDEVLNYLADQEEKDYDLVAKVKGAMIYPVFIICGLIVVGIAMMIFVIPQLTSMLTASGAQLPLTTRILIFMSNALRGYWWALLILAIGLAFVYNYIRKTPKGVELIDYLKLKIPLFGSLFKNIYLVRFTQSLSTLTHGGVPITVGLQIVSEVVGNNVFKNLILETIKEVEDGNSLAVVFLQSEDFPKLVSQMLSVGEKTGRLAEVLDRVSGFYGREIDNMVANMSHLLEPFIMVVIGVAVGGMVASIILPMYNLANSF